MKSKFAMVANSAFVMSMSAAFAAGPGGDGNVAFSNVQSPNNCAVGCVSIGVVQFGKNGGIANTHGQAGWSYVGSHVKQTRGLSSQPDGNWDLGRRPIKRK